MVSTAAYVLLSKFARHLDMRKYRNAAKNLRPERLRADAGSGVSREPGYKLYHMILRYSVRV